MIKERLKELVSKLLGFKFVIFVITTVLVCLKVIGTGEWLTVTTIVIAGHEGQKGFNRYLSKGNHNDFMGQD